jgi:hypothetical protein
VHRVLIMRLEAEQADAAEAKLFDTGDSSQQLPPELAQLKARQAKLQKAFAEVQAADKARRSEGIDPQKNPAQVPTTDVDSKVLPNKEGGYAPNYTPLATTDAHRGFIVDADVLRDTNEQSATLPAVDRIRDTLGQTPERVLADGARATGENIEGMEQRGVDFYTPVTSHQPQPGNPVCREDLPEAAAHGRDAVWDHQAPDERATVPAAGVGEREDGVVLGLYGVQSCQVGA